MPVVDYRSLVCVMIFHALRPDGDPPKGRLKKPRSFLQGLDVSGLFQLFQLNRPAACASIV